MILSYNGACYERYVISDNIPISDKPYWFFLLDMPTTSRHLVLLMSYNVFGLNPTPLFLTVALGCLTTGILTVIGIPLGYCLSRTRKRRYGLLEALISLPLVLPPTVLGFYLLLLLSPASPLGMLLSRLFNTQLLFTFKGLVFASCIASLPFMVNPIKTGFSAIPPALLETAYTLGKSKWETLFRVMLPNNSTGILTGMIMCFAHTLGEFGVILMIGGNIPNKTRLASIAIYSDVEALNYTHAHAYAGILVTFSFAILCAAHRIGRHNQQGLGL